MRIGTRQYPVVLPRWKDPRLSVSAVVMSVLIIGIATLGFRVSIPQILASLITALVIEGVWAFRHTGKLVWPASGLNTATGIALILRVVGTGNADYWSFRGWYVYALVVAFALLTKYVVQFRGTHIFNPSNIALVLVFVLLGSSRVEPLDFWWAPLGGWMVVIYLIILSGGLITLARLRLVQVPVTFWLVLAAGLGLLAGSGHCFTARWSVGPVCGPSFWWVVLTSPELLFFVFFMITDPKTIPEGRAARIIHAVIIGVAVTLLVAPQGTEFGAKVGLLAGLAVVSPLRWLLDRWLPEGGQERSPLGELVGRLVTAGGVAVSRSRTFWRGALAGALVAVIALLIVAFGAPARQPAQASGTSGTATIAVNVDPATLPAVSVDPEVSALNSDIGTPQDLAITLAKDLEIEAEAMQRHQGELLLSADFGARLDDMLQRMTQSVATGEWVVAHYHYDSLHLRTVIPVGGQGTDLGFEARGTVDETTYDADGGELHSESRSVASLFVLRLAPGDLWLIVDETDL
jgi:hypothetical protein